MLTPPFARRFLLGMGLGIGGLLVLLLFWRQPAEQGLWDLWNGLGVVGFAALCFCVLMAPSGIDGYSAQSLKRHAFVGTAAVLLIALHVLGILFEQPTALEYLKLRAPSYMHAGNFGFFGLLFLAAHGMPSVRRFCHRDFRSFVAVHRLGSAVVLALVGWHLIGAGYLLSERWQQVLFVFALVALTGLWWCYANRGRWPGRRVRRRIPLERTVLMVATLVLLFLFVTSRR